MGFITKNKEPHPVTSWTSSQLHLNGVAHLDFSNPNSELSTKAQRSRNCVEKLYTDFQSFCQKERYKQNPTSSRLNMSVTRCLNKYVCCHTYLFFPSCTLPEVQTSHFQFCRADKAAALLESHEKRRDVTQKGPPGRFSALNYTLTASLNGELR